MRGAVFVVTGAIQRAPRIIRRGFIELHDHVAVTP